MPNPGYPGNTDYSAAALAFFGGYVYVGYMFASHVEPYTFDWWFSLLLWPLAFVLVLLVNTLTGKITTLLSDPSNASAIITVFSGFIPYAVVYVASATINKARKSRYSRVHTRRNQLSCELDKLSKEVSSASHNLDTVEREISEYRNKYAQKMRQIKWKLD